VQGKKVLTTLGLLVGGVLLRPGFARADTITTFNVAGATDNKIRLTGTFQVDVTVGKLVGINLDVAFRPAVVFDNLLASFPKGSDWSIAALSQDGEANMSLEFTTTNPGSLVGFTGGTITGGESSAGEQPAFGVREGGTITPAPEPEGVPEPSSLALLAVGFVPWLPIGFARRGVLNYRSNGRGELRKPPAAPLSRSKHQRSFSALPCEKVFAKRKDNFQ
jgi:hypothetical protein